MALASYQEADSVVELSLSPVYHYQFSSIAKVLDRIAADEEGRAVLRETLRRLGLEYFHPSFPRAYFLCQTDTTPLCKPHSPTLEHRTYVAVPNNVISGNKPVNVGYELSWINLSDPQSHWSLPLSIKRVLPDQTPTECALEQLQEILSSTDSPLSQKLLVNTLDSKYGNAYYLAPAHQHSQLISVVRLRAGMKVWKQYTASSQSQSETPSRKGSPRVYGEKYYLRRHSQQKTYTHPHTKTPHSVWQPSIFEAPCDETLEFCTQTAAGRKLHVQLWAWNRMMIRTKAGHNMKDKPFRLVAYRIQDAHTGELLYQQDTFLAVSGKCQHKLPLDQVYSCYRHRYDIEPFLRFTKQRLLLEDFQTPDINHLDNWLIILQMVPWLLYTASQEAHFRPRKWEAYLPQNKHLETRPRLSIAQTRKAAQELFLTFDSTPFKPTKCKKGNGRQKGVKFPPRIRYKVLKKTPHKTKRKQNTPQIE